MSIVILSELNGVYLGSCMGLGFWSKLDPVGQPSAVTFSDKTEAEAYMRTWPGGIPNGITYVNVFADDGQHATIASCVKAGLPGWVDEITPVANSLPI